MLGQKMLNETSQGNVKEVKRLISRGVDVNTTNRYGVTPLMVACLCNWPEVVRLLLDEGADTERRESFFGCTALMFACMSGGWDSVQILLDHGADVEATDTLQRTALTVAHSVDNGEAAKLLLQKGARENWKPAGLAGKASPICRRQSRNHGRTSSPAIVARASAFSAEEGA
jgi:ankyrin repeat protein